MTSSPSEPEPLDESSPLPLLSASFSACPLHSQQVVCSQPPASGNAAAIISARRSLPIRCTGKLHWTVHQKWRRAHPGYWKQYRQHHPEQAARNRQRQQRRDQKRRLVNLANNNLALDLKCSVAEVWLLGPAAKHLANNNLATCQVMIFQSPAISVPTSSALANNTPLVLPPASAYNRNHAQD